MHKNPTMNITKLMAHIDYQATNQRLPNATLFYGQSNRIIYNTMAELAGTIHKTSIGTPNNPSDARLEPAEDIIIINPQKTIKIDHIKSLQDRIKYGPANQTYCIVIIHNIQRMTNSAVNALLKSIEEPPKNTVFFLSTQNKFDVPKTIQSRAQLFHCPESLQEKTRDLEALIEEINQKTTYIPPTDFLNKSPFEQTIFIQGLPYDTELMTQLINAWKLELYARWPNLEKKEHAYLEKMIEIISNIKYNFNLKLQLLVATFQTQEDDLQ
jgi:DNA polymerase III delta prime subunit